MYRTRQPSLLLIVAMLLSYALAVACPSICQARNERKFSQHACCPNSATQTPASAIARPQFCACDAHAIPFMSSDRAAQHDAPTLLVAVAQPLTADASHPNAHHPVRAMHHDPPASLYLVHHSLRL